MKAYSFVLAAFLGVIAVCSCSKDRLGQSDPSDTPSPKEYIISIGCGGEITDVSVSDLTKADESDDLYAIQVFSSPAGGDGSKAAYAHGLFTTLQDVSIKLVEGYKYSFIVTLIKEGKTRLSHPGEHYYNPVTLTTTGYKYPSISQNFIYETNNQFSDLGRGAAQINGADGVPHYPNLDRYYGEYSDYVPTEGGKVTVDLKRTSFGLKVIADGLTEGSLSILMKDAPELVITSPATEIEDIFSFYNVKSAWATEDYKENVSISFNWTKPDGVVVPLVTQSFDFYRNRKTMITVKVEENGIGTGLGVNPDDTPIEEGNSYNI